MALEDRTAVLATPSQVDEFVAAHPVAVVFKASSCHRSVETFARVERVLEVRDDAAFAIVPVVEARAASDHLAAKTGIRHESPQLLVFRGGALAASRNHWEITAEALVAALPARLAAV